MNDQLQQALAAILNNSMNAIQAGVTFLQAELPNVIRQLLMWHATYSGIKFGVGAALAVIGCILLIRKAIPWAKSDDDFGNPFPFFACIGCSVGMFVGLGIMSNNLIWLQILVAPKIYLIEYAASLVTK